MFKNVAFCNNKEINLDANQVKNLETTLIQQMTSSIGQADVPTVKALEKLVNKEFSKLTIAEKGLIAKYARETGIVGRRTDADFTDIQDLVNGKSLQIRPRTVQRVNPKAKLLAGGLAGASLIPGMVGMMAGQAPDATGSAIPNGPMGMPQLGPGMGGFGGGYGGPQAGDPNMGNFAPTQYTGLGHGNTVTDPASQSRGESGGYAPTSGYTGRSEGEINPAAKYRTNEVGMMRGEAPPAYNNYSAGYNTGPQSAVTPIQTPVTPVQNPVGNIEPVAPQPVAPTDGFNFYQESGLRPAAPNPNFAYDDNGNIAGEGGQAPAPPVAQGLPPEYATPMINPNNPTGF